jgi:uncharacterized Zn finger protein
MHPPDFGPQIIFRLRGYERRNVIHFTSRRPRFRHVPSNAEGKCSATAKTEEDVMQTHTAQTAHTVYDTAVSPSAISTVFNWLKRLLEARRARLNKAREVEYLLSQDRRVLEDIGIDIANLGEEKPKLESFNPHIMVVQAICRLSHNGRNSH